MKIKPENPEMKTTFFESITHTCYNKIVSMLQESVRLRG